MREDKVDPYRSLLYLTRTHRIIFGGSLISGDLRFAIQKIHNGKKNKKNRSKKMTQIYI